MLDVTHVLPKLFFFNVRFSSYIPQILIIVKLISSPRFYSPPDWPSTPRFRSLWNWLLSSESRSFGLALWLVLGWPILLDPSLSSCKIAVKVPICLSTHSIQLYITFSLVSFAISRKVIGSLSLNSASGPSFPLYTCSFSFPLFKLLCQLKLFILSPWTMLKSWCRNLVNKVATRYPHHHLNFACRRNESTLAMLSSR